MTPEDRYHHGDLRRTLVQEGLRQARTGGPSAIGLRELTRAVGVSPNAAYRHFADREALVRAVAGAAQRELARAIHDRVAATPSELTPAEASIERLRRIGLAYIGFARAERGWFEVAFLTADEYDSEGIVTLDDEVVEPFQLLLDALDAMVATGTLDPSRRPNAEWACWAAVHGFAEIAVHGPLRWQPSEIIDALAAQVVDTVIEGVRATPQDAATDSTPETAG